jgi:hypothetical protein
MKEKKKKKKAVMHSEFPSRVAEGTICWSNMDLIEGGKPPIPITHSLSNWTLAMPPIYYSVQATALATLSNYTDKVQPKKAKCQ